MHLRILLPYEVFAVKSDVLRVIAEGRGGSFGLLPHRLDCVSALVPGILTYETQEDGTVYLAVDEGVLVKAGSEVLISVRHAIAGKDLGKLREAVQGEFLKLNKIEREMGVAAAQLESGFIHRMAEFQHSG